MIPTIIAPAEVWCDELSSDPHYSLSDPFPKVTLYRFVNGQRVINIPVLYQNDDCYVFSANDLIAYYRSGYSEIANAIEDIAHQYEVNAFEVPESEVDNYDY